MIYVVLRSADIQIDRVAIRVSDGGHDVPQDKIVSRRLRSFEQLAWFLKHVDSCFIYDNSDGVPDLLAELNGPALVCWKRLPPDMESALRDADTFIYNYDA